MKHHVDWRFIILSFYLLFDATAIRQSHYFMFWAKFCAWKNCHIFCFHLLYIYSPALGIINGQCRVTGYILILSDCWSECLSYKKIEVYAYNAFFILQILFGMVCRMSGEIMCSPVVSLVGFLKAFYWLTESIPSLVYYFSGVRCLFFI